MEKVLSSYFDRDLWKAPILTDTQQVRELINTFNLVGKKVKAFYTIGCGYDLQGKEDIINRVWNPLKEMGYTEEQIKKIITKNQISPNLQCGRYVELFEPFMIEFEGGDTLELLFMECGKIRISKNEIPIGIDCEVQEPTFDPNRLFSTIIGKTIEKIDVFEVTDGQIVVIHGIVKDMGNVGAVEIHFDNGQILSCSLHIDDTLISVTDTIAYSELMDCLLKVEE